MIVQFEIYEYNEKLNSFEVVDIIVNDIEYSDKVKRENA